MQNPRRHNLSNLFSRIDLSNQSLESLICLISNLSHLSNLSYPSNRWYGRRCWEELDGATRERAARATLFAELSGRGNDGAPAPAPAERTAAAAAPATKGASTSETYSGAIDAMIERLSTRLLSASDMAARERARQALERLINGGAGGPAAWGRGGPGTWDQGGPGTWD